MSKLGELGLSSYEEKAYRALLSLGSATARTVSAQSGVPQGRIYDVLNGLTARDLVRSTGTDPTTYTAVDPETVSERLLAERRRELDARAERYADVAAEVGPELAADRPTESRFWTAPLGGETAVTLCGEVFDEAADRVRSAMARPYAAAPWERYEPEVEPYFETAGDAAVQCLVHASMLEGAPPAAREYLDAGEFRVTTDLGATFDLIDDERVCFHVPHPLERGERLGVIDLHDADLAARLADCFEAAWADAVPLADVLDGDAGSLDGDAGSLDGDAGSFDGDAESLDGDAESLDGDAESLDGDVSAAE